MVIGLDLIGLGRLEMTKREIKKMNEERWAKEREQREAKRAQERPQGQQQQQQAQTSTSSAPLTRVDTERTLVN